MESFCTASADRTARIVDGLEAQGEPLPFLLAILTNQIRSLIKLRASFETSGNLYVKGVFATNAMKAAARRIPLKRLAAALDVRADIDRLSKGLTVRERDGDPWIELKSVCLFLARTR